MTPPTAIALDHSADGLAVACAEADGGAIRFRETLPGGGREAAALLPRLVALLDGHGCELRHIRDWTVGTGPGGFTALRALAAFVAGLTADRPGIRARGIPSDLALAAAASPDGADVAILHPQRDGSAFVTRATCQQGHWRLADDPAQASDADHLRRRWPNLRRWTALASHRAALAAWQPAPDIATLFQDAVPVERLLRLNPDAWRRDSLSDIVYLRPAAVAKTGNQA